MTLFDNEYDYKGKRLSKCSNCGFILPEEFFVGSTCTCKHMDRYVRMIIPATESKNGSVRNEA